MADVDTENLRTSKITDFGFRGIPKIMIPKTDDDFRSSDLGASILKKYLPICLSKHKQNAEKIEYYRAYYQGKQDICEKTRLYSKDSVNNNRITENHALRQIDFKVGFLTGEHREYTAKTELKDDDTIKSELSTLNKYFTDCNFFAKDKDLKEWVYNVGVGVTVCKPRTDIIIENNGNYSISPFFDIENEAPFKIATVSPIDNFVVYSSGIENEPLFCVSIFEVEKDSNSLSVKTQKEIHIETRYASFICNSNLSYRGLSEIRLETEKTSHYLPIIEHWANMSRMGIVELNRDLFNSINTLVSSVADMVVDNANIIYVFKATDITDDEVKEMVRQGAIVLPAQQIGTSQAPDLNTITISIPFSGLNEYYEQRLTQAYDIAGVPLASGAVTSGGDTGQARLLGGGWNNAYTIIRNDINSLNRGDLALLKLVLFLCKLYPNSPIKKMYASQIDIKYRINQSDNFLVKAQGIAQLYSTNMPKELILKYSGISSDIGTEATAWEEKDTELRSEKTSQVDDINSETTLKNSTGKS